MNQVTQIVNQFFGNIYLIESCIVCVFLFIGGIVAARRLGWAVMLFAVFLPSIFRALPPYWMPYWIAGCYVFGCLIGLLWR